jgi:4-hydroxybenzoate polyprenyltransferase
LLGNLFWVLAYDTEYAMVDRDDDLRIGMKTSAITLGRWDVAAIMVFYAAVPGYLGSSSCPLCAAGAIFYVAIAPAGLSGRWHFTLIRTRTREGCFKAFRINHWVGATVFAGIVGSTYVAVFAHRIDS